MKDIYIDAGVFIGAACDSGKEGRDCDQLLREVHKGAFRACTSTLTVDEVLWVVKKNVGRDEAGAAAKLLFTLNNLFLVDATAAVAADAVEIFLRERVDPRDAIHVATMRAQRLVNVVSVDSDFDKVAGVKRFLPGAIERIK